MSPLSHPVSNATDFLYICLQQCVLSHGRFSKYINGTPKVRKQKTEVELTSRVDSFTHSLVLLPLSDDHIPHPILVPNTPALHTKRTVHAVAQEDTLSRIYDIQYTRYWRGFGPDAQASRSRRGGAATVSAGAFTLSCSASRRSEIPRSNTPVRVKKPVHQPISVRFVIGLMVHFSAYTNVSAIRTCEMIQYLTYFDFSGSQM
ncbi:hypothetical protein Hypma_011184 [Hypsizygus marmoreus]|uniref:Uncharacterized protein n=1 Tax=Hypsizygus marmoreus TaxID=39966 RepID=A0A369JHB0_HYPMA|nr:hypothetical protein Hypma_011184 [Hypsizygus marmoreus]